MEEDTFTPYKGKLPQGLKAIAEEQAKTLKEAIGQELWDYLNLMIINQANRTSIS